jgi:cobalt transporter subunit CbtA
MKHMVSSALIAGFAAGLLCALLQYLLVEPKILLAERYESGELVHFQGVAAETSSEAMPGMAAPATHDHGAAEPAGHEQGGAEQSETTRHALTVFFAALIYCGYGLVLMAGIRLAEAVGVKFGVAQGILWGLAAFACFQLMPALGLEPELPGTPAADLTARQVWWVGTAVCTMIGLWFLAYGSAWWQRVAGVVVLAIPHVWGAPELEHFGGVVPPELASAFAARALAVGMITWMVLGGLLVKLWHAEPAK